MVKLPYKSGDHGCPRIRSENFTCDTIREDPSAPVCGNLTFPAYSRRLEPRFPPLREIDTRITPSQERVVNRRAPAPPALASGTTTLPS
jgi:hypothetical protein